MLVEQVVTFFLIGGLAGFAGGLFGIGGGIIFVPSQILIYTLLGIPPFLQMKMAVATSLFATACTTFTSARAHSKHGAIIWKLIYKIAFGITLGSLLGAYLARILPGSVLKEIFGGGLCILSVYLFFFAKPHDHETGHIPGFIPFNLVGMGVGTVSAMLGMSGGVMLVPALMFFHQPIRKAVGTASGMGFLLAVIGVIGFILPGFGQISYPYCFGYLYIPALVPLALGSVLTARWGARLTHSLPLAILKKIFAIMLLAIGILMMFH